MREEKFKHVEALLLAFIERAAREKATDAEIATLPNAVTSLATLWKL